MGARGDGGGRGRGRRGQAWHVPAHPHWPGGTFSLSSKNRKSNLSTTELSRAENEHPRLTLDVENRPLVSPLRGWPVASLALVLPVGDGPKGEAASAASQPVARWGLPLQPRLGSPSPHQWQERTGAQFREQESSFA